MIVGAPEDDSEQAKVGIEKAGAVYRCQTRMPFRCDQIPFDTSGNLCPSLKILTYSGVHKSGTKGFFSGSHGNHHLSLKCNDEKKN